MDAQISDAADGLLSDVRVRVVEVPREIFAKLLSSEFHMADIAAARVSGSS